MGDLLLKIVRYAKKISKVFMYKYIFFGRFKISPLKSYFDGTVNITKQGRLIINDGFRNKKRLNVSIAGGIIKIKNNVFCNNNVSINCMSEIEIGEDTIIGENVCIYDHDHRFRDGNILIRKQGFSCNNVIIGRNVWIGSNVVILSGTKIDDGTVISAGSIVKGHVPKKSLLLQKRNKEVIPLEE